MAFVNLPPNLQDIFYSITDRIAKLETGPNQALYVAESAQGSAANASAQAASAQASALAAQVVAASASAQATIASAQAVTAQATANTAYLAAQVASAQAITANNTANAAASQATIAQSQATIASSQATAAQVSADGKNKVYYSTSTPGSTANTVGDIWYQYGTSGTYLNKVIAQYSGAGGTSWTSVTVSGLVIANIDAGSITTGTLQAITISAGSGANSFYVSSSGVMSAQGAYIKGNITADSGTFNGQVNAGSGYFGSLTNGWQINSGGIAGLGSGYISGGTIQGTNFNNGNGTFFVNSAGNLVAQSVYVKGAVLGTSGYFGNVSNGWNIDSAGITGIGSGYIAGGAIQGTTVTGGIIQTSATTAVKLVGSTNSLSFMNAGTYVGHILNLSSSGILMHLGATASSTAGSSYPYQYLGTNSIFLSSISGTSISLSTGGIGYTTTTHDFYGTVVVNDTLNVSGSATFGTSNTFQYLSSSGTLRSLYTYGKAVTGRAMQINSAGDFGTTASTLRKKHDVQPYAIDTNKLLNLKVKTFKYLPEIDDKQEQQYGFIAEEAEALDLLPLVLYNEEGQVDYFAYEKLPIFLLQLAQEQDARLKILEGK
jgi:hypothetical protein